MPALAVLGIHRLLDRDRFGIERRVHAEFAARGGAGPAGLKQHLRSAVDAAAALIRSLPHSRLTERVTIQSYDVTVLEAIYHVVEHFSGHTGQVIFATKLLTGEDLGFHAHLSRARAHSEKTP